MPPTVKGSTRALTTRLPMLATLASATSSSSTAKLVPAVREVVLSAYVRGAVSGLGLLNVALGLADVSAAVSDWLDRPRATGRA